MATRKATISVRLDEDARRRVEMAATLMGQSRGSFLGKAGQDLARQVLRDFAVGQYRAGAGSLSKMAARTGLGVEEIAEAVGASRREEALQTFLASCRAIAESANDPDFLRMAEEAVRASATR